MAAPKVEFYSTDVSSAGSRVQIVNNPRKVLQIWVKGAEGNAGNVYFGDSSVSATVCGFSMPNVVDGKWNHFDFTKSPPLQSFFYVDAATSGDNVETIFLLE